MSSTLLNKKIEYWEHQLLDLGKRNKMINYRETKRSTLKLLEPAFEDLFQRLAINEESFKIKENRNCWFLDHTHHWFRQPCIFSSSCYLCSNVYLC